MEISGIADDTMKFERIIAWCAAHADEVAFALHQQGSGKGSQPYSGKLKSEQEATSCVCRKSLKKRRKVAMKWRGERDVLTADVVRTKNSKTFQFLSFPFIASHAVENGMRGDPNKFAHPVVNTISGRACRLRF